MGSLYNHLTSKESLLYSIMSKIIEDLLAELDTRLATVTGSVERLRAAIEVHVFFHTARAREVFIGNSELRSLTAAHRRKVVKLRDQYEERFVDIIEQGSPTAASRRPTRRSPPGRSSPWARARRRGSAPTAACNSRTSPRCTPTWCSTAWRAVARPG